MYKSMVDMTVPIHFDLDLENKYLLMSDVLSKIHMGANVTMPVMVQEPLFMAEDDYGDSWQTALHISDLNSSFSGTIDSIDDEDWFLFTPETLENVRLLIGEGDTAASLGDRLTNGLRYQIVTFFGGEEIKRDDYNIFSFNQWVMNEVNYDGPYGSGYDYYLVVSAYQNQVFSPTDYNVTVSSATDSFPDSVYNIFPAIAPTEDGIITGVVAGESDVIALGVNSSRPVRITIEYNGYENAATNLTLLEQNPNRDIRFVVESNFNPIFTGLYVEHFVADLRTTYNFDSEGNRFLTQDLRHYYFNIDHDLSIPLGTEFTVTIETLPDDHQNIFASNLSHIILNGSAQSGVIDYSVDVDAFIFDSSGQEAVTFLFNEGAQDWAGFVHIYDVTGESIGSNQFDQAGQLSHFFDQGGRYYLLIPRGALDVGDVFTVSAYTTINDHSNSVSASATQIAVNSGPVAGTMNSMDDRDVFELNVSAGQTLDFDVALIDPSIINHAEMAIFLYDAQGNIINYFDDIAQSYNHVRHTFSTSGTIYVGVYYTHFTFSDGLFDYTLDVTTTSEPATALPFIVHLSVYGDTISLTGEGLVYGSFGDDVIRGSTGRDDLRPGYGDDRVYGGSGDDRIRAAGGENLLYGEGGNDKIEGGSGVDLIFGGAGDDEIFGGYGDDVLHGGAGNDIFNINFFAIHLPDAVGIDIETDIIYGDAGTDTLALDLHFSSHRTPRTLDLSAKLDGNGTLVITIVREYGDNSPTALVFDKRSIETHVELHSVEHIVFADGLVRNITYASVGTSGNDFMFLGVPGASLNGQAGDDVLVLGDGDNTGYGGAGRDYLFGNAGNDTLYGGAGRDVLIGGRGDDALYGGLGDNLLDGGFGNDTAFYVGEKADYIIQYVQGSETIQISTVDGLLSDEISNVEFFNFAGTVYTIADLRVLTDINGTDYDETIVLTGTRVGEGIFGRSGDDTIIGSAFDDIIYGDSTYSGPRTSFGNDTLYGNEGNDSLHGHIGDDYLDGGVGDDYIMGDEGQDVLIFGIGADFYDGGYGIDLLDASAFAQGLQIDLANFETVTGEAANDVFVRIENILGTVFDDQFYGTRFDNEMSGGLGHDTLLGRDGHDTLEGGQGNDNLDGGEGIDFAVFTDDFADYTIIENADGSFMITHNNGGLDGVDTLINIEVARFQDGNVVLSSAPVFIGNLSIFAGTNRDDVLNASGDDGVIFGAAGNDVLYGGRGDDVLYGGADADIFYIDEVAGNDSIMDFEDGVDHIVFSGDMYQYSQLKIYQDGADVIIASSNGVTRLVDTNIADIDASDFIFRIGADDEDMESIDAESAENMPDAEIVLYDEFGVPDETYEAFMLAIADMRSLEDVLFEYNECGILEIITPDDAIL